LIWDKLITLKSSQFQVLLVLLLHPQPKLALRELMEKVKLLKLKNLKTSLMVKLVKQTQDFHMLQLSFKLKLGTTPRKFQFLDL